MKSQPLLWRGPPCGANFPFSRPRIRGGCHQGHPGGSRSPRFTQRPCLCCPQAAAQECLPQLQLARLWGFSFYWTLHELKQQRKWKPAILEEWLKWKPQGLEILGLWRKCCFVLHACLLCWAMLSTIKQTGLSTMYTVMKSMGWTGALVGPDLSHLLTLLLFCGFISQAGDPQFL